MGYISTPLPPLPKDPAQRAAFLRAYVRVQKSSVERHPSGGSFGVGFGVLGFILGWVIGSQ